MKRIALLLLLSGGVCFAEEVTLTQSAVMRADRSIVSLKAGTVVELVSRNDKTLTVRYGKNTGTIPVASIAVIAPGTVVEAKKDAPPAPAPAPAPVAPPRKAETNYGRSVEKAKENAAKHEKNLVKPADEILQ